MAAEFRGSLPLPTPSFGDFLRHLRDERSLSREGLAKSAGVSASYINHLEIGRRDHPTRPIVEALAGRLERALPLSEDERRYLFDLAGLLDIEVPGVADLRADISGIPAGHGCSGESACAEAASASKATGVRFAH
ncbi:helix-turn-helix domain-containing protein [Nocardia tengchongensis]|uniref:helix-turn-helix domain-containing protein n=2 Tax=Nocardia tengchongensis TaxID=2055889 RepID=UPI0036811E21